MSSTRKNTFIARKSKINDTGNNYSHDPVLRTEAESNAIVSICNKDNKFDIYQAVTLADEQLKLIMDEKSQKIKENLSLDNFNPFSPKVIEYKKEMERFTAQKEMFSRGLFLGDSKEHDGQKNASPLKSALAKNTLFDSSVIKLELFSLLEPVNPFKLKTPSTKNKMQRNAKKRAVWQDSTPNARTFDFD